MVIYDLICSENHEFEGWFKSAEDFKEQQGNGLLECPYCGCLEVNKKLAAPKVGKKSNATSSAASQAMTVGAGTSPEKFAELQAMLGKVHDFVEQNFEDVGDQFAEEAISIHRGESDKENIRGTATAEQVKELADEGVATLPLPPKPIDKEKLN